MIGVAERRQTSGRRQFRHQPPHGALKRRALGADIAGDVGAQGTALQGAMGRLVAKLTAA